MHIAVVNRPCQGQGGSSLPRPREMPVDRATKDPGWPDGRRNGPVVPLPQRVKGNACVLK